MAADCRQGLTHADERARAGYSLIDRNCLTCDLAVMPRAARAHLVLHVLDRICRVEVVRTRNVGHAVSCDPMATASR